jgi:hypothetical protein
MAENKGSESTGSAAEATDPNEDQKAKFREALDRKSKASHKGASAGTGKGPVYGEHAAEANKREFRRKSGG